MTQTVVCYFSDFGWYGYPNSYTCRITDQVIEENADLKFQGTHASGKSNQDVVGIDFANCTVSRVPQNLTKAFPNAELLEIANCNLRSIKREDLKEYSKLTVLSIFDNGIAYLPGDLLSDMKDLQYLRLCSNKTRVIEPNLLDELEKLEVCDLSGNQCINMEFDDANKFGNTTLEKIKAELIRIYEKLTAKELRDSGAKVVLDNRTLEELQLTIPEAKIAREIFDIIKNDDFRDFTITVGEEEFKAHKFLLAARSPVLAEMIKNNRDAECLNLVDIKAEIFKEVLNFMYTGEFPASADIKLIELYGAAGRLKISKLQIFVSQKLCSAVNFQNAFDVLRLSNKFEDADLREKAFKEVKKLLGDTKIDDNLAFDSEKLEKIWNIRKEMNDKISSILKS